MKRIHISKLNLEELQNNNNDILLAGYVENVRDHGDVVFIDLNNDSELLQLIFNPDFKDFEKVKDIKAHSTIKVVGKIIHREDDRINKKIKSGLYELKVSDLTIVSIAAPLPIDENTLNENVLLANRNIQLRGSKFQNILKNKSQIMKVMRNYLEGEDFVEFETPLLTRTTPGGAKDFLTLSSQHEKNVYGLVQSPQMFKQLLMTSGFERYYQFAKCFRDEELRSDRQPEFLQLDIEMSWAEENDVINLISGMVNEVEEKVFDSFSKTGINSSQAIYPYQAVMDKYGSDKPDLRFNLELININDILKDTTFNAFKNIIDNGGVVKTITIPADHYSKKGRKDIEKFAVSHGAKGLGYLLITDEGIVSPLTKFLSEEEIEIIMRVSNFDEFDEDFNSTVEKYKNNRIIYFIADEVHAANKVCNELRNKFAKDLGLIQENTRSYLWVYNFPMFEKKADGNIAPMHHPFTKPYEEDIKAYEAGEIDIYDIGTYSYDLVLNGSEIGGGSVRIESKELQEKVFEMLNMSEEDKNSMEWFTELFKFGVPEHAGFAMGVDRFVQKLLNLDTIRDSIPFPKNSSSECSLTNAPSEIDRKQWKEYGLKI